MQFAPKDNANDRSGDLSWSWVSKSRHICYIMEGKEIPNLLITDQFDHFDAEDFTQDQIDDYQSIMQPLMAQS